MRKMETEALAPEARIVAPPELGVAEMSAAIAEVAEGDLLVAVADEMRGALLSRALRVLLPDATIVFCPGTDALPGDDAPASPANVGQRVSALRAMRRAGASEERSALICITTGEALASAYPAPERLDAEPPRVAVGDVADLAALRETLCAIGYVEDECVDEPGEIALRGQVLDVFPADAEWPLRIEAPDGQVTAIRAYDPADQRSIGEIEACGLGRAAELPAEKGTSLLAHLPGARLVIRPGADERRRRLLALAADARRGRRSRAPEGMIDETQWQAALQSRERVELTPAGNPPVRFVEANAPLRDFARAARAAIADGDRIALLGSPRDLRFLTRRAESVLKREARAVESWPRLLATEPGTLVTLPLAADRGFRRAGVFAVAAADLIGSRAERDSGAAAPAATASLDMGEIRIGDVVIHEDHGLARVAGLESLPAESGGGDAIRLDHAKGNTRLVPVAEADRLWRYGAEADAVTLDTLNGGSWQKRRGEIDAAIAETARQLSALAEERAKRTAPVLDPEPAAFERFAAGFAFTETADQLAAIEAVRSDLARGRPMDRLVVGDVGYGKTEVALRAAALAALAGRQVAVAAPTTVLARQHLESLTERFADSGIAVAGLSRLTGAAEKKRVLAGLADGSIRIVVGTGAIAGKGVRYADLALVIVDEEQRFGAADKAKLQALSAGHVLSLSATPIPRTLQSALVGLRELSLIATPPARRQPIRTTVGPWAPDKVRTALLRERSRGGQSFVVVPRIEDMGPLAEELAKLVPELEILQAHGKMPAVEIDGAMVRFGRGEGDVLLATNIIEAGLDVPRANTMAIVHADRFGLSQLHQLRGRVGRGNRRGQVLLFTDKDAAIAPRTLKRLRTLEAFDRLGAGFAISARDLDMRGAGDLMGETQAGHMRLIGVDLYQMLLEGALRAARGEDVERWTPELHLGDVGCLPEGWVPDEDLRVSLYARLARLRDEPALHAFEEELVDRFGPLPAEAAALLAAARIRIAAALAGIARIDAGPAAIALTPRPKAAIDAAGAGLVEKNGRLLLAERIEDPTARVERVQALLHAMTENAAAG